MINVPDLPEPTTILQTVCKTLRAAALGRRDQRLHGFTIHDLENEYFRPDVNIEPIKERMPESPTEEKRSTKVLLVFSKLEF